MDSSDAQRKLTAILCADVVGYSRLMGENEKATVRTLTDYRQVFSEYIGKFRGRIVNAPGDSILAEFGSVVDAVDCAAEIQRELAERNGELLEERRMAFRIGVNLGDVIVKDDVIYGDGVNIAARLESLAEPGGICVSRHVYDHVRQKLKLHFEYMGEQQVKNIKEPVRAYRVLTKPGDAAHRVARAKKLTSRPVRLFAFVVAALLVIGVGGYWIWQSVEHKATQAALAAFEQEAALPLPDKPSIAVLAFENMSGDPEQEYFSDGLSEDIITKLASLSRLFVIARNSSFQYKGKQVDVRRIGRELGVRYLLEGSVRKSADRVRITVQLIDAATGQHLFAKRYDRELQDIFVIQDDIANQVLAELNVKIGAGEGVFHALQSTNNLAAFDAYMRAGIQYYKFQKEANFKAEELVLKAIELDPKFVKPMSLLGWVYMEQARRRWVSDPKKAYSLSAHWAKRAIETDPNSSSGLALMSRFQSLKGKHEEAIALGKRAVELEPSNAGRNLVLAFTYLLARQPQPALETINRAMRLAPYPPAHFHVLAGMANSWSGRYEVAVSEFKKALGKLRGGPMVRSARRGLIVNYMKMGEEDQAKAAAKKLMDENPGYTISIYVKGMKNFPYKDFDFLKETIEILRKAELPE